MSDPILATTAGARRRRLRKNGPLRKFLTIFPLMILPVLIYVLIALFAGQSSDPSIPAIQASLDTSLFSLPMISGVRWHLRVGDVLLLFALLMLSFEIVKSTSTKSTAMVNHAASMGLLIFCLMGFLIFKSFATSVFFFLAMMSLLDVLAGVMVTIVSARRDFGVGDGFGV